MYWSKTNKSVAWILYEEVFINKHENSVSLIFIYIQYSWILAWYSNIHKYGSGKNTIVKIAYFERLG